MMDGTLHRSKSIYRSRHRYADIAPEMGGADIRADTRLEEVASFVLPEDRLPFLLCVSLYSIVIEEYARFVLMPKLSSERVGVWFKEDSDIWIIGLRGTAITSKQAINDLMDDRKIAFGSYCDLSLVNEAAQIVQQIIDEGYDSSDFVVAGHSLGGAAALCLGARFSMRCISFNGGAAPTNPVIHGPGPRLATHYHIFGDLVSTHISVNAAKVIRMRSAKTKFGEIYPHGVARFLRGDGIYWQVDATEEDEAFLLWASNFVFGWRNTSAIYSLATFFGYLKTSSVAKKSPIPDSKRSLQ